MPSGRFNAGEKVVFWGGVIVLGLTVVASGLVLDKLVPGMGYTRGEMQIAHMVHAVASFLMMAMFVGHIYMGTIGVKGSYAGHAHRLRRRGLGQGAPRTLVRRHQGRQDPGACAPAQRARGGRRAARAGLNAPTAETEHEILPDRNVLLATMLGCGAVSAKLPPPSDEAKAKAAEAAAKTAHNGKVDAYKLCK